MERPYVSIEESLEFAVFEACQEAEFEVAAAKAPPTVPAPPPIESDNLPF